MGHNFEVSGALLDIPGKGDRSCTANKFGLRVCLSDVCPSLVDLLHSTSLPLLLHELRRSAFCVPDSICM